MEENQVERDVMEYDILIIGGGPSGLSSAIKVKQLANAEGKDVSVCVLEKGSEIGAHILSGNVFQPNALDELIPNWKDLNAPLNVPVKKDEVVKKDKVNNVQVKDKVKNVPIKKDEALAKVKGANVFFSTWNISDFVKKKIFNINIAVEFFFCSTVG